MTNATEIAPSPKSAIPATDEWELIEPAEITVVKDEELLVTTESSPEEVSTTCGDVVVAEEPVDSLAPLVLALIDIVTSDQPEASPVLEASEVSEAPIVETTITTNKKESVADWVRKTGVAVAGGTMVGVGLVMIPLPTPFGAVVAGSGMAVLGTEFPAAQRALDRACNKVADAIDSISHEDVEAIEDGEKECKDETTEVFANESMKEIMDVNKKQQNKDITFKSAAKQIGRKAAPAIRKIGGGIDKEQLTKASENVSKAASGAKAALQFQVLRAWRHVMVLDEGETIMTQFQRQQAQQVAEAVVQWLPTSIPTLHTC